MRNPFDCPGCAQRRAAITEAGRKMAEWFKPGSELPMTVDQRARVPDSMIEVRALACFLNENSGMTEADWHRASEEFRIRYRQRVKADL